MAQAPDFPGLDFGDRFRFWPKHNEKIYERLESKHAWLEEKQAAQGDGDLPVTQKAEMDPLENEMILNIGPQHPATHGVLRCVVKLDGETVEKSVLDIGYLHRGIEKLAEHKTYQEFMPYTDRMDYLAPYSNNVAWCLAVEKLAGIEVPERAQWIRMIMSELARISSHCLWLGVGMMDAGAVSGFLWTFQQREEIYAIMDEVAGARFTVSHSRIGGVANDLSARAIEMIEDFTDSFLDEVDGWETLLNRNRIWVERNKDVGRITKEEALELGVTGPNLRGSGVPYDVRRFEPYLKYDEVDFTIPVREEGDCLARYFLRLDEMKQSVRIINQCLDRMTEGPIRSDDAKEAYPSKEEVYYSMEGMIHDFMYTDVGTVPPKGAHSYHAVEGPKGELGFYLTSDGTGRPWRVRMNSPSFTNLQAMEYIMEGSLVADTVIIIGSLDPVMGEADK
ncbi:NADH dehydrogenase (quinone) subunit D [Salinibacter sp. 10B]|uniref:NADH dehydrogenase (quinone) subunit D n=1 Tax=Salinibacter sp. 10B TaxID=1923971 RepID=UPI000CF39028|nr:NADH dehydrogenase (quinone) subunit D [Salinibacter sp. 10B]PQJ35607.1 NADH dehydrogenase (quinone) subunit D [Salinibacter sp. 10B]